MKEQRCKLADGEWPGSSAQPDHAHRCTNADGHDGDHVCVCGQRLPTQWAVYHGPAPTLDCPGPESALEALRSLEKDTTPGPWRADTEHSPVSPKILSACMIRTDSEWPGPAMTRQLRDAAFIVAAVEYVRAALAAAADAPQPERPNRQQIVTRLRDWLHETPLSRCTSSSDECDTWPLAYEVADRVFGPSPAVLPEKEQR